MEPTNVETKGGKPVLKIVLTLLVVAAVVAGAYYALSQKTQVYRDDENKITLEKPRGWEAGSVAGYARVAENSQDIKAPSVLIKIDYPESIIPSLGLDTAEEVVVGGKTVRRIDHEWETKSSSGEVTGKQTFTFLMWTAPSGKKIIFEITPWQKPSMSVEVEEVVRTFSTL